MTSSANDATERAGAREWVGLAVLALPSLLIAIDVSVMMLALPLIGEALHASSVEQLWIMDIYGFMLSGFLVTMGTLGDRIGRRKLLMFGATAFALASVAAAFSTSPAMLIGARALLGIAGATLAPSILALITNMFRDAKQRSMAIGLWLTCFMSGMALGPLVGGAMITAFWWGSPFLLGVPVMLLLLVAGPMLLPDYRDPKAGRLDLASVALSLAAILPVIYGLKEIAHDGAGAVPLLAVAAGLAVGLLFVARQRRLAHPLIDLRLFSDRSFSTAVAAMFGITLTGANMLFLTQYLQLVRGYSPLVAGLWMLPGVLASAAGFMLAPLIARRVRPAPLIASGLVLSIAGLLCFAQVGPASPLALLVVGFALFNFGATPLVSLGMGLVVGAAPPEKAGSAAAISETSGEFAFAIGIAALGSLGTALYRGALDGTLLAGLPEAAATLARDSLAGATVAAEGLSEREGAALLAAAHDAFAGGMHAVAYASAAVVVVIALLTLTMLRHVRPIGAAEAEAEPA